MANRKSLDPSKSGIGPAAPWAMLDAGEWAVRQGRHVCGWINEKTPGAALVVLTDAGLVYNLRPGTAVFISQFCYAVETASDDCQFEFGYTTEANGAGTFVPLAPHKHVYTGAANLGRTAFDQDIRPFIMVTYESGARSITFRVDANDASAVITVGFGGWWEPYN